MLGAVGVSNVHFNAAAVLRARKRCLGTSPRAQIMTDAFYSYFQEPNWTQTCIAAWVGRRA